MALSRTIFVFSVVSAMVLCISWQETRVRHEGRRLQELNAMHASRTAQVLGLKAQVARLKSPQRIMLIVEALDIGLEPPRAVPPLFRHEVASIRGMDMPGERDRSHEVY